MMNFLISTVSRCLDLPSAVLFLRFLSKILYLFFISLWRWRPDWKSLWFVLWLQVLVLCSVFCLEGMLWHVEVPCNASVCRVDQCFSAFWAWFICVPHPTPPPLPPLSLIYLCAPIPFVDTVTSEKLLFFHIIYTLEYIYILFTALDSF